MESLIGSIAECLKGGKLPRVPAERKLEDSLFPARLHPSCAALDKELISAWGETYGRKATWAKDIQLMGAHHIAALAGYFWPNSTDLKRAMTLIKLMQWFTLVDDAMDDLTGLQAHKLCSRLIQATFSTAPRRPSPPQMSGRADGLHHDLQLRRPVQLLHTESKEALIIAVGLEWWNEMQESTSPTQRARFSAGFIKYLQDQVRFTYFREKLLRQLAGMNCRSSSWGAEQLLEEYILVRRVSSGFPVCVAMVEYDVGIELDEESLRNPRLQELQDAVCDEAAWLNDILSFPKEFANGEAMLNLVPLLLHCRRSRGRRSAARMTTLEEAIAEAWQMTEEREQECARLHHQNSSCPDQFPTYVQTVCGITSGIWAWTLQSPRYHDPLPAAQSLAPKIPNRNGWQDVETHPSTPYAIISR